MASSRSPPPCARWRAPRTDRPRWSRSRRSTTPIRCSARSTLEPAGDLAAALAERDGAFGAAVDPALLARLNIERGARVTVGTAQIELRAILKSEPDKLAGGIGFGPRLLDQRRGAARDRAGAARQPGPLALPREPCRRRRQRPHRECARHGVRETIARRRLGSAHARQCLARARPQHRALHAVPHAGRPHRAARRRRRRRERREALSRPPPRGDRDAQIARRDRRPRVRDLSHRGHAARRHRHRDRPRARRAAAVRGVRRLRAA